MPRGTVVAYALFVRGTSVHSEEFDLALNYRFAQIARARLQRRKPDRKADWYVQGVRREE